jgi:hypothetical protein
MEAYQYTTPQYYYNIHLANASYDSNNYFASTVNSYIDVAGDNGNRYVPPVNAYANNSLHHINHGHHGQEPLSTVNSLSFDATSNIQHVNPYSLTVIHNMWFHHKTCR